MSTTTVTRCDFCSAKKIPTDKDRWGMLVIGPMKQRLPMSSDDPGPIGGYITGEPRDVCPVCIARLRQVAGAA